MIEEESGMRWLCGGEKINYHTLSSFRMERKEHLDALFTQVLAVLESEELIDLSTVMQDGTKVRAQAGKDSFHRRKTLEDHLARARTAVEDLHRQSLDSAEESGEGERKDTRVEAARSGRRERKWRAWKHPCSSCGNGKPKLLPGKRASCGSAKANPRRAK
jgi:hypothetical protein